MNEYLKFAIAAAGIVAVCLPVAVVTRERIPEATFTLLAYLAAAAFVVSILMWASE